MHFLRLVMIPALTFSLSACGTMVNGVEISPHPAQGGDSFCERNMVLCIGGGLLVIGGVALAASGHSYHSPNGTSMGGSAMGGGY